MNVETAEAVHSLKLLEPVERYFASASDELKQLRAFLFVEGSNSTPKPLDLW